MHGRVALEGRCLAGRAGGTGSSFPGKADPLIPSRLGLARTYWHRPTALETLVRPLLLGNRALACRALDYKMLHALALAGWGWGTTALGALGLMFM